MKTNANNYTFEWRSTEEITVDLLKECAELFAGHYGEWGEFGPRPHKSIRLSPEKLKAYLDGPSGRAAFARENGRLICYAFAVVFAIPRCGWVAWVTQLVTHSSYREQGVATRVLRSIWTFSDFFAWGLVTANPYAIRALEGATHRLCDNLKIEKYDKELFHYGQLLVPYVKDAKRTINALQCVVDTQFYVKHENLKTHIQKAKRGEKWMLGPLAEGQEWVAFTFREQDMEQSLKPNIKTMLDDSEEILKRAYEGMSLDENHSWRKFVPYEVDFVLNELRPDKKQAILDLGCGTGRHTGELARRGYQVTGVDFVRSWIEQARSDAVQNSYEENATYVVSDARTYNPDKKFKFAICLYDVVGSFVEQSENQRLLTNLAKCLTKGGKALLSVMNLTLTKTRAKHKFVLNQDPDALLDLQPSNLMQTTGDVFDPDYFLLDTESEVVYRKEQFDLTGHNLPAEVIVRDRRYEAHQIAKMCNKAGLDVEWIRFVRAGHWEQDLGEDHPKAKEILLKVVKR